MEYLFFSDKGNESLPPNFRKAISTKGVYGTELGEPIRQDLTDRWTEILKTGLRKDAIRDLIKKYPTPKNFPGALAPMLNPEVATSISYLSLQRDRRYVSRQNMTGKLMSCLLKALTNIFNNSTNMNSLTEQISDAASFAAEIYHQDSLSRQLFALAGASKTVRDVAKDTKPDEYLFGKDFMAKVDAALKVQRISVQNKTPSNASQHQRNWKSPLPQQQRRWPLHLYQNKRRNSPRRFYQPHSYHYRQKINRRFPPIYPY